MSSFWPNCKIGYSYLYIHPEVQIAKYFETSLFSHNLYHVSTGTSLNRFATLQNKLPQLSYETVRAQWSEHFFLITSWKNLRFLHPPWSKHIISLCYILLVLFVCNRQLGHLDIAYHVLNNLNTKIIGF